MWLDDQNTFYLLSSKFPRPGHRVRFPHKETSGPEDMKIHNKSTTIHTQSSPHWPVLETTACDLYPVQSAVIYSSLNIAFKACRKLTFSDIPKKQHVNIQLFKPSSPNDNFIPAFIKCDLDLELAWLLKCLIHVAWPDLHMPFAHGINEQNILTKFTHRGYSADTKKRYTNVTLKFYLELA